MHALALTLCVEIDREEDGASTPSVLPIRLYCYDNLIPWLGLITADVIGFLSFLHCRCNYQLHVILQKNNMIFVLNILVLLISVFFFFNAKSSRKSSASFLPEMKSREGAGLSEAFSRCIYAFGVKSLMFNSLCNITQWKTMEQWLYRHAKMSAS